MRELSLQTQLLSVWKFRLYLLKNLPMALLAGLRINHFSDQSATVSVPFGYLTKNPFRSTYFACLAMAGELASGIQVLDAASRSKVKISTLVTGIEGQFFKKATGTTFFICEDGKAIRESVLQASEQNDPVTVFTLSKGIDSDGQPIANFTVIWSIKRKTR